MTWHLIEGRAGCAYAKDNGCVAVIVDALRASATAAMLLDAGVPEICVVREVEDAFRAKDAFPSALLIGERGGLPPEGFDRGNSPRNLAEAAGRTAIFTTTTGTLRILDSYGASAVYVGTTLNALGVVQAAAGHGEDIVLIPAGQDGDPNAGAGAPAQEDWAAATAIAMLADATVGEGALEYRHWRQIIELDGLPKLFETAPHADRLREVGCADDIAFCAKFNVTGTVPHAVQENEYGVILRAAS